jgi:pilus assembly protein Flp/PilA
MFGAFKRILSGESGATKMEYSLIAALVSVASIIALTNLGASISLMGESGTNTIASTSE